MRRDKINTLLMKQDFMVHEQQEAGGKKGQEYRNIRTHNSKRLIKDLNHALKIILATGDKKKM